jgi:two-component system response regulator (stage 0 sporulation protein F)
MEDPVPRILVVDDEENLRELYLTELSEEGYEVLLAANGKEAIELLKEHKPDAVIMDIRMPEMDGIETLGKMVTRHKNIPIIIHTAYSSYREDFRSWAAEAYVVKSSDLTVLKQALHDVLEAGR